MDSKEAKRKFHEVAQHVIPEAARQKAYRRPLLSVNLVDVYAVMTGWETEELSRAVNMEVAVDMEQLESSLKRREPDSLLIRKAAGISIESLAIVLKRCVVSKYIFLER